ncbi:uncharacterized protein LOC128991056 [Macrosteles quadrilineatus]|uniref:uncharacterized protein LOC128991056 n=1 Tax=Macrosteles quadrilineatus TaxID=74068 RepID=UPI0023E21817|nr:uncharacterized protein LOC128991056 [Macrosteles quadrilineatus]
MYRIVLLSCAMALCRAQQYVDPKTAAILKEERYLSVDGKFGAAYQQEDGVQFKEESDADGTRRGSYSYIDPSGQRRTISYVAGKNGFVPTGDHLPAVPAPVVNPLPQYNPPQQSYNPPQQSYNPPQQSYNPAPAPVRPQYSTQEDDGQWVDDTKVEYPPNSPSNWNNPAPQTWNTPAQPSWNANPAPQTWSNPAPQQWSANPTPAPVYNPTPAPQRWSAPVDPTPAPHRFFPPGKLSLNRAPDGFSFSFSKA